MGNYVKEDDIYYWITDSGKKIPVDIKTPSTPMRRDFFRPFITRAMKYASSTLKPDNPLTKAAQEWKKKQAIVSLTYDELLKDTRDKKVFVDQKVDGQTALMDYKNGKARFGSLGGRIHTNLPVLNGIEKILKQNKIEKARIVGELVGYSNGKIIPFNESESLIKNPKANKEKVHWFPYQILNLNDENFPENDFESYLKIRPELDNMFRGAKYVHPTKHYDNIKEGWEKIVEKEGNEGIVVRTSDKIYKAKPIYTYDLVIVAVGDKKLKSWPKKRIGNTLVAFMDKDEIFRTAGEVGTGWTDKQREELYDWAQDNKVSEDEHYVWVKPKKIMKIQWERSNIRKNPAYKYEDGEYKQVEDKLVGTIVKPRFIEYREDKNVEPDDLRLEQIPDWEKRKEKKGASMKPLTFDEFVKYRNTMLKRYSGPQRYRPPQAYKKPYEEYLEGLKKNDEVALKIQENAAHLFGKTSTCHPCTLNEFMQAHNYIICRDSSPDNYFPPQRILMLYDMYCNLLKKEDPLAIKYHSTIQDLKNKGELTLYHGNGCGNRLAAYPDHPDEIVISKNENILDRAPLKEIDVWSYYEGIKKDIVKQLKGHECFVVIKTDGRTIYRRHPFGKESGYIEINNEKDFEEYQSGRTVEFHVTADNTVKFYAVDMDPPGDSIDDFNKAKKAAAKVSDALAKIEGVDSVDIHYTGKRGFHIFANLRNNRDVNEAREFMHKWLKETFGDDDSFVLSESPSKGKIALGLAPLKKNGGHVAKWSMRVSGLCCVPVKRNELSGFKREEATPDKVYRKLTGKELKPLEKKESMRMLARIVSNHLKSAFVLTEPGLLPRRLRQREIQKELKGKPPRLFAEPGEKVKILEHGKWKEKPWNPLMAPMVEKGKVQKI